MTASHIRPEVDASESASRLPLRGIRVLDYAQYVAGPFATMLLADLGADVIKVEPPRGDAWRHYEPITADGGTWFFALNRDKRSVVADLYTEEGQAASRAMIADADVVVHNMPPARAEKFGLDRESVLAINSRAVWSCVSAFGSAGPDSAILGYDLIAQAASGLLTADVRIGDEVPRRSGGIAMADLTAGLLTTISVLAGLADVGRSRPDHVGRGFEVSLLGAALAVQVQRFVSLVDTEEANPPRTIDGAEALGGLAQRIEGSDDLEPYYRCYRAADGFIALACLNIRQRQRVQDVLGIVDPYAVNPQAPPADEAERIFRSSLKGRFAVAISTRNVNSWIEEFRRNDIPSGPVREIHDLHDNPQARMNGLVQRVEQPGVGQVSLLGSVFKIDGVAAPHARPAPQLGAHNDEVLGPLLAAPAMERV